MDIVQRNLFRLLRNGAFHTSEEIEPMSVYKWGRLYQLAVMHQVVPFAYEGLNRCQTQFFLHLTDKQRNDWRKAASDRAMQEEPDKMDEDEFLRPNRLTNPLLNRRLQQILDDEQSDITTRRLLLMIIRMMRHLFNEGMPIRQLMELGLFLRREREHVDFITFARWLDKLQLSQMAQLCGELLICLYDFDAQEIPFMRAQYNNKVERIAQELVEFSNTRSQDWYFSQEDGGIFVHNSNSSATFSHMRRSARYFRYNPSESVTNFFISFIHSLSHIEE